MRGNGDGLNRSQVKYLKVSRTSVNKWLQAFLEEGLEGLQEKPRTGSPAYFNVEQRKQLSTFIKKTQSPLLASTLSGAIYMTTS
ncbi:helix-turn-helix domain-containing protein [Vibrio tasmaniensis]|uniref:helix-turn-helix domain-containing protein n=1 Tax=Vibrio tasmaniensis TaxID=212663 RepID=UPI00107EFB9A